MVEKYRFADFPIYIKLTSYIVRKFANTKKSSAKQPMVKACILAFVSGIFFFFLVLQSAWWLVPGVLSWTAIFVWQDRQDRAKGEGLSKPNKKDPSR
jgi:hypothetical protein